MIFIGVMIVVVVQPPQSEQEEKEQPQQPQQPVGNSLQPVCPACGWSKVYTNIRSARNGLAAHRGHCAGAPRRTSEFSRPFIPRKR